MAIIDSTPSGIAAEKKIETTMRQDIFQILVVRHSPRWLCAYRFPSAREQFTRDRAKCHRQKPNEKGGPKLRTAIPISFPWLGDSARLLQPFDKEKRLPDGKLAAGLCVQTSQAGGRTWPYMVRRASEPMTWTPLPPASGHFSPAAAVYHGTLGLSRRTSATTADPPIFDHPSLATHHVPPPKVLRQWPTAFVATIN